MANYIPSNKPTAQAKLFGRFNEEARKAVNPVTYLAIKAVTEIMLPSHKELRLREDRAIDSFTFSRTERALDSGRSDSHTGNKGDTLVLTPSFNTLSDPFSISLKQADKNLYSHEDMFVNEVENSFKNFMKGLESAAIDFVFNGRSQINVGNASEGVFDATDNVYKITEANTLPADPNGATAAQITDTIMEENNLRGSYLVFCDSFAYDKFIAKSNQGAGNSTNTSFQDGNKTYIRSIGLDDSNRFGSLVGTYNKGVWISVPVGAIGHLDWIPKQNMQGVTTTEQTYGSMINPIDSLDYATHNYGVRSDQSGSNGYTQDQLEQWEISLDSSFVLAPVTTATESVAQAFAFV